MKKRNYLQYCSLARALDLVGERWTLLIIRDLLAGPRRYKDLQDSLNGIGTNLLASRLKELETNDLVEATRLAPPFLGPSLPAHGTRPRPRTKRCRPSRVGIALARKSAQQRPLAAALEPRRPQGAL